VTKIVTSILVMVLGLIVAWRNGDAYVAWALGIAEGVVVTAPVLFGRSLDLDPHLNGEPHGVLPSALIA
jgi:hypothetical protein